MARRPEIGNVALYPDRPLTKRDKNGYVLKFYCPIQGKRIRRNCGTRDRREARRILRECRERLLNGDYVASDGAITAEIAAASEAVTEEADENEHSFTGPSWDDCVDRYRGQRESRLRDTSFTHALSRVAIAERVFVNSRRESGLPDGFAVDEVLTLETLEDLQDQLLNGAESRLDRRSPTTVNSILAGVMAFARFCHARDWIRKVPPLKRLPVQDVMKGRPISAAEFDRMIDATPKVVGEQAAPSWRFALRVLWESGFRVADLMDFSWDDRRHIHPVWPDRADEHPTLLFPGTQKNGRVQEVPMLPGLVDLLQQVDKADRSGRVVTPEPLPGQLGPNRTRPSETVLVEASLYYSNSAIARVFDVSETAVRKWFSDAGITAPSARPRRGEVPEELAAKWRESRYISSARLTKEHVGRVIARIGKAAGVLVQEADPVSGRREKYASAHDLRRGCALRLIDLGVTAETLKVVMRHESFATTERYYGASRSAQVAGAELQQRFANAAKPELVGGLMGWPDGEAQLDPKELAKLKALLAKL